MIKLLGITSDQNSSFLKGPALAPPLIRQMGIEGSTNLYSESGIEIKNGVNFTDLGDIKFVENDSYQVYKTIKEKIQLELTSSDKILSLGGDHSISYPVIEAYAKQFSDLHVLHLDAHADLYDNFDNNPYSHASPFARLMEKGLLKSLSQVGIRTLNKHQSEQVNRFNSTVVEMRDFDYNFIKALQSPLYVSVDLDVLDPAFAPGVSHHEPGGISTRELITIIQSIPANIVGADIVEYNPVRDVHNMTAMLAFKLFKELASKMMDK